ncbi:MAG: DUF2085 domain-containing protein [Anaerolineae bacterium]|nr:DUF2085 domain-containing protein [Anaerolineae bacterium]
MTHQQAGKQTPFEDGARSHGDSSGAARLNRAVYWVGRHWLLVFLAGWGAFNLLPWLAPVFMKAGWDAAGRAIYTMYTFLCHQLPQRSYFLFGVQPMYELNEVQAVWQNTDNPLILRQFIGNPEMGWKVAWSDRMVSLYTGILLWAAVIGPWRRRLPRLPLWGLALLTLPMVIDGGTHMVSDMLGGIGGGFRYDNAWLAALTNTSLASGFYAGDGFGTFNSWMRLITGLLFSLGAVWFTLPVLDSAFAGTRRTIEGKFEQAGLPL